MCSLLDLPLTHYCVCGCSSASSDMIVCTHCGTKYHRHCIHFDAAKQDEKEFICCLCLCSEAVSALKITLLDVTNAYEEEENKVDTAPYACRFESSLPVVEWAKSVMDRTRVVEEAMPVVAEAGVVKESSGVESQPVKESSGVESQPVKENSGVDSQAVKENSTVESQPVKENSTESQPTNSTQPPQLNTTPTPFNQPIVPPRGLCDA